MIAEEGKLYALGGADPAHPWRKYRVVERFEETDQVFSLILAPVSGETPRHRTGQYVAIAVDLPNGERQPRQYTISSGPRGDALRVTIKAVRGEAGSPMARSRPGCTSTPPPGRCWTSASPQETSCWTSPMRPWCWSRRGSGSPPSPPSWRTCLGASRAAWVRLFHADRTHHDHALYGGLRRQVLAMDDAKGQNWYEAGAEEAPTLHPARPGRMDLSDIDVPSEAQVFMCGPLPFMQEARQALLAKGILPEHIHYKVFGPDLWAHNPDAALV